MNGGSCQDVFLGVTIVTLGDHPCLDSRSAIHSIASRKLKPGFSITENKNARPVDQAGRLAGIISPSCRRDYDIHLDMIVKRLRKEKFHSRIRSTGHRCQFGAPHTIF